MSSKPEIVQMAPGSGLATWRRRKAEEKIEQVKELDKLREDAVTVMRDGREYRVVTIPDKYEWGH